MSLNLQPETVSLPPFPWGVLKSYKNVSKVLAVRTLLREGDFGSRKGGWGELVTVTTPRRPWP